MRASRPSIRRVLVGLMVLQTGLVGLLVTSLSLRYGRRSVDELAARIAIQTGQRVDQKVVDILTNAHRLNEVTATSIDVAGMRSAEDHTERIFSRNLAQFDVSLCYVGFPNGDYVGSRRHPDGSLTVSVVDGDDGTNRRYALVDGERGPLVASTDQLYDPRLRPWYIQAVDAGKPVWTQPYLDINEGVLGITAASPMYDDGELVAVMGTDVLFDYLERFLAALDLQGGAAFVEDDQGLLIASSTGEPVMQDGERVATRQATHPLVRQASLALTSTGTSFQLLSIDGVDHYIHGAELHSDLGLDWRIVVAVPRASFMEHIDANLRWTLLACLLAILFAAWVGAYLTRRISEPLRRISAEMEQVALLRLGEGGDDPSGIEEVAVIQDSLANMKRGLRSFGKYVPLTLVRRLVESGREASLGVEPAEVTLFFSDLAGFTTISEQLDGESLVELMGAYLGDMSHIVLEHGGTLDKYIGDAIMAFWNAPDPIEDHASVALDVAMLCQARLAALRAANPSWPHLHMRIGLHSGEVLVGNFGAPERMDYTALGDAVNLAARLEALNKSYGTEILVSEAVAEQVSGVVLRRIDKVALRGRTATTLVFEPMCREAEATAEIRERVQLYEQALALYFERAFEEAIAVLHAADEPDPAMQTLLARCQGYLAHPPEPDWDGVFRQRTHDER